jgi:hypothetical protein
MADFDLVDLTQPVVASPKTDPTFTLRMAEATLYRAQAAEIQERIETETNDLFTQANKTAWAAERELLLARADYVEHVAQEPDPIVQALVRIADALNNSRLDEESDDESQGTLRNLPPLPDLEQRPGESDHDHWHRTSMVPMGSAICSWCGGGR